MLPEADIRVYASLGTDGGPRHQANRSPFAALEAGTMHDASPSVLRLLFSERNVRQGPLDNGLVFHVYSHLLNLYQVSSFSRMGCVISFVPLKGTGEAMPVERTGLGT